MKKILFLLVAMIAFTGCTLDDNNDTYTYSILPVESYELPETFTLGETYEIKLKYQKPTGCHLFQGIYYSKELNTRTVAIQTAVKDNEVCTAEVPALSETSFNFLVTNTGSYIFKFYKGKDTDGENIFEEVEIQVAE
ncbi:membrane lipoprotein lipid attachment site-containing protein [Flavobacterium sp. UMI-01]|uniref:membrane lipoprotein lipid attachment site-containing protein n=1 Tax=Flavobacterium sp. UMI-01 TaxID=1441053 RepID=UPI001C7D2E1E|nr:membrane lipoprotein lipid attachment site-containing protein [Flavobacterium sp. UMI-01]GIZ08069.1 hypothetical protein FUMI01_07960 [Flavobacterium sp. UMI-01]